MNNNINKQHIPYRKDIDGLRAIAILLVVLFHFFPTLMPGGFVGVDVFFVISGFLITSNILRNLHEQHFSILDFYARRVKRILPALIVVLLVTWATAWVLLNPDDLQNLGRHIKAGSLFTSNILLYKEAGYFDVAAHEKPLLHLWSLAIEEQFYLFWPLIVCFAFYRKWNIKKIILTLIALSFSISVYQMKSHPFADFYLLPSRFWELAAGCLLAKLEFDSLTGANPTSRYKNNSALPITLLLIALAFAAQSDYPGWFALFPILFSYLVIRNDASAWLNRGLANKEMVLIGKISYPLYLWHWPILSIAYLQTGKMPSVAIRIELILLSFILAFLTWRIIESRVQLLFKKTYSPPMASRWVSAGVMALATISLMGVMTQKGYLVRTTSDFQHELIAYENYPASWGTPGCFLIHPSSSYDEFPANCQIHAKNSNNPLLIWGDSYSASISYGIRNYLQPHGMALSQFGASECPPVLNFKRREKSHCEAINNFIFAKVVEKPPTMLILAANWNFYVDQPGFFEKLELTINKLHNAGIQQIVVMGQVPLWDRELYKVLLENFPHHIPERSYTGINRTIFETDIMMESALKRQGVSYVKLLPAYCNSDGCLVKLGPNLATDLSALDRGHPTKISSNYIAEKVIGPTLLRSFIKPHYVKRQMSPADETA